MAFPPTINLAKRRVRRKRHAAPVAAPTPPPAALVLIYADYDGNAGTLIMQFDRAIDFSGIDELVIHVNDPVTNFVTLEATGLPQSQGEDVVVLNMIAIGASSGSTVRLNVGANNGIVAADDGGAWAGVTNVELPLG